MTKSALLPAISACSLSEQQAIKMNRNMLMILKKRTRGLHFFLLQFQRKVLSNCTSGPLCFHRTTTHYQNNILNTTNTANIGAKFLN